MSDESNYYFKAIKAYNNTEFLNSRDGRLIRILAEYLEPASRFRHFRVEDTIVFFGSARIKPRDVAEEELRAARTREAEGPQSPRLENEVSIAERNLLMSRYYEDAVELARLLTFPNVLVTAHQAFLTREALNEIARVTVENVRRFTSREPFLEGTVL